MQKEKYTKKEIVESYFEVAIEDLVEWCIEAKKLIDGLNSDKKSVASTTRMIPYRLRAINTSINNLHARIKDLFITYKELEDEYELEPLSVEYFEHFSHNLIKMRELLINIYEIADNYQALILNAQEDNLDKYITPYNQKSIQFLSKLTEDTLLKALEEGYLLGV